MKGDLLVIEDDVSLNRVLVSHLNEEGFTAEGVTTRAGARGYLRKREPKLVIMDIRLPDTDGMEWLPELAAEQPVIVLTAYGSINDAVAAIKAGAADYLTKPVTLDELDLSIERVLDNASLRRSNQFFRAKLNGKERSVMVGASPTFQRVRQFIEAVAPNDVTVLIQGESGVGKELVARAIHDRSPRTEENYVAVDCCTLQRQLFESEVFGHERGAFTGADKQKEGLIEVAEGGTIFLDEIGEITTEIQAKLLRFLETGEFRRLGGVRNLQADVRVVAATNRDLQKMIRDGGFRADLYYRLAAFVIEVPPLRKRRQDIPALIDHFIRRNRLARRLKKRVTRQALQRMQRYEWPGNIRELRNIVERAVILSGDNASIEPCHLSFCIPTNAVADEPELNFDYEPTLEQIERQYLSILVERYQGHRQKIARAMGVSVRSVYRMVEKYGLQAPRREPGEGESADVGG